MVDAIAGTMASIESYSGKKNVVNIYLLIVMIVGIHTAFTLPFLPHGFLAFSAAFAIMLNNLEYFDVKVSLWFGLLLVTMAVAGLASSLLGGESPEANIRAVLNFVYDVFIGYNAYIAIKMVGRDGVRKIYFFILLFLLGGAILEVMGLVKPLSDWFRTATLQSGLYIRDERDVTMYGLIRPKFFASEPAKLGETMAISMMVWLSLLRSPRISQYAIAAILTLACLYFVRSPVIAFGVIAYGLIRCATPERRTTVRVFWGLFATRVYMAVVIATPIAFYTVFNFSSGTENYFTSGSFFARMVVPFFMAVEAISKYPWFGIGMVAEDKLTEIALAAFTSTGRLSQVPVEAWDTLGGSACSAFWFVFISIGIIGAIVLYVDLLILFKLLRTKISLMTVCSIACFTYWIMFGRMNSPVAWVTFFTVLAMCALRIEGPKDRMFHTHELKGGLQFEPQ